MVVSREEFARAVYEAATRVKAEGYPVMPSVATAQACLESRWGEARLAREANNLFGIKATQDWRGPVLEMPTTEHVGGRDVQVVARWRKYESYDECLRDYGRILQAPRYVGVRRALAEGDPVAYAKALQEGGWATDPGYATKILEVLDSLDSILRFSRETAQAQRLSVARFFLNGQELPLEAASIVGDKLYVRTKGG